MKALEMITTTITESTRIDRLGLAMSIDTCFAYIVQAFLSWTALVLGSTAHIPRLLAKHS